MLNKTGKCAKTILLLLLVAAFVAGCGSTMRSDINAGFDDLSGNYRYTGLEQYSADQFPNPLINLSDIAIPSDVYILQSDEFIQVAYTSNTGEAVNNTVILNDPDNSDTVWRDSMLTTTNKVPVTGAPILPLPAKHYRGTRILRAEDGNLYFIGFFEEKGFLFTDYWEHELLFQRIE